MDTRTPEQAYQEGFENGRTNGYIGAMAGEEPLPPEALEEALAAETTDNGRAWTRGWHEGYNGGHRDAYTEGVDHNPELMAQQAESEVLARDQQQNALYAYRDGFHDGYLWDLDEEPEMVAPSPRAPEGMLDTRPPTLAVYVEPPIQSMPDDVANGYEKGFIDGYRRAHPGATEAEAQDEYLWRIYGHDDKGNTRTLEERDRYIAAETEAARQFPYPGDDDRNDGKKVEAIGRKRDALREKLMRGDV